MVVWSGGADKHADESPSWRRGPRALVSILVSPIGDREQSAVAEGEERSTSVALPPGKLRGTAGRHRRSARGDHWGTNTRGDCWGVRLKRRNATVQESTRGRVSPRLRLACWCRTSSCCRPGSGSALTRARHRPSGEEPGHRHFFVPYVADTGDEEARHGSIAAPLNRRTIPTGAAEGPCCYARSRRECRSPSA